MFIGGSIGAVKNNFTVCGAVKKVDEADEGGFTTATGTNNRKDLPSLYFQIYRIQNFSITDLARKTGYLD
jgi:UDP-N-acetylglucosamine:LPS N-acetylglucosamine transferase